MQVEYFVGTSYVSWVRRICSQVHSVRSRQVQTELFRIEGLAMLVAPSFLCQEFAHRGLAFADVSFIERTLQSQGVGLVLTLCSDRWMSRGSCSRLQAEY